MMLRSCFVTRKTFIEVACTWSRLFHTRKSHLSDFRPGTAGSEKTSSGHDSQTEGSIIKIYIKNELFLVQGKPTLWDSKFVCISLSWYDWKYEPPHDKTNRMTVRPAKTQISLGICPVWSVFTVCMKKASVLSYPLSAQQRLIRLGRCPGWSESSLGTHAILLVLSCRGSYVECDVKEVCWAKLSLHHSASVSNCGGVII